MKLLEDPKLVKKAKDMNYVTEYAGKWVLVVDDRVVASGDTLQDITKQETFKQYDVSDTLVFLVPTREEMWAFLAIL